LEHPKKGVDLSRSKEEAMCGLHSIGLIHFDRLTPGQKTKLARLKRRLEARLEEVRAGIRHIEQQSRGKKKTTRRKK
jgi:hypothetical protein